MAAHGSSIAVLQSLSNKADQSAFDVLEGVVATKSTLDGVDLQLSNYSTTAAMNGSIASANNATLARWPPTTASRRWWTSNSLDIAHAAGGGHQGGQHRRQRPDCLRPAVGRGHFLGGGL